MDDRYGTDVLADGWRSQQHRAAAPGRGDRRPRGRGRRRRLLRRRRRRGVRHSSSSRTAHGRRRLFPLGPGFLVDGGDVVLVPPDGRRAAQRPQRARHPVRSPSPDARARVARASRILVEGRHDAELVEKVWGDDLRAEGVVVEYLQGIDLLEAALDEEPPTAERRYGVLVDHLVAGSKESRIADAIARGPHGAHIRSSGIPYIDVWQCVTPRAMGIARVARRAARHRVQGRRVPRPRLAVRDDQADIARAWQRILGRVSSYRDLEPALLGRVEELIDFVSDERRTATSIRLPRRRPPAVGAAGVAWRGVRVRPPFRDRPVSFVRRSGRMSDGSGARLDRPRPPLRAAMRRATPRPRASGPAPRSIRREVWGRDAPLVVEIGSGQGHAIVHAAHPRPRCGLPRGRGVHARDSPAPCSTPSAPAVENLRLVEANAPEVLAAPAATGIRRRAVGVLPRPVAQEQAHQAAPGRRRSSRRSRPARCATAGCCGSRPTGRSTRGRCATCWMTRPTFARAFEGEWAERFDGRVLTAFERKGARAGRDDPRPRPTAATERG